MKVCIKLFSAENGCNYIALHQCIGPYFRLFRKDRNTGAWRKTRDFICSAFIKEVTLGSEQWLIFMGT